MSSWCGEVAWCHGVMGIQSQPRKSMLYHSVTIFFPSFSATTFLDNMVAPRQVVPAESLKEHMEWAHAEFKKMKIGGTGAPGEAEVSGRGGCTMKGRGREEMQDVG